ncbi:MTMR9 [Mytilus edulis]|uniref:MTMR9 n=1 Tax=Mytilus edulis TaxID=6550 RepID=A0A8S3VD17_MYTED|nr:MTMR9 [Mytilus edulis]
MDLRDLIQHRITSPVLVHHTIIELLLLYFTGASVLVHGSEGFDTTQDYLPCASPSFIIEFLLLYFTGALVLVHGSEGFDTTQDYLPCASPSFIIEFLLLYFTGASVLVHGSEGFDTTQDYLPWASVLVHGSEGFDTTLQVTSLVQLILDHDCRTINGFEALVEREWLQGGHPFADRCSKSAFAITKQRSESPIFLLFLDCVWQIWQQFPCSFEFNEEFLVLLFEHTYSSQFGTFLCNNEKERKECKLSSRTVSLWTYLARPEVLQKYLNPMYDPNPRVIWPSVAPQSLVCNIAFLFNLINHIQISYLKYPEK